MKRLLAALLCLLFSAAIANGEQAGKKDAFWDKLQNQLVKVAPVKKQASQGIPGGVRGAKNDEANDVYWKGKDKTVDMADDELQKFSAAVATKIKGDNEQALKLFEEFLAMYPQSSFRVEGMQAAEKIRLEIAATKAPAAQPAIAETPQSGTPAPAELSGGTSSPATGDAATTSVLPAGAEQPPAK